MYFYTNTFLFMEYEWFALLLVGFFAGGINTLAGGGSLLTLPFLIFLGLPPSVANGTNRIAILFQTASSIAGFRSKGVSGFPLALPLGISALAGSLIGAQIAIDLEETTFNKILAVVLLVVGVLIAFQKKRTPLQKIAERTRGKYLLFSVLIFFFVGVYGGFINAGIGIVMLLVLPAINRLSLVKANATKVSVAFIYTTGAFVLFVLNGKINWSYGLTLAIGNALGAWMASRYAVKKGEGFVRVFLLVIVSLMAFRLWYF